MSNTYNIGFCSWNHRSPVAGFYKEIPENQLEFVLHALQHVNNKEILFISGPEGICIPKWGEKTWLKSGRWFNR